MQEKNFRTIKTFVKRAGKISTAQENAYNELSNTIIPFTQNKVDFTEIFGNTNPVTVEIGFGMGKATALIAKANPQNNYLGFEVYKAGVARLLYECKIQSIDNIRIFEHDALEVIEQCADNSITAFHIFFPDPWQKKKHHKRRLIQRPLTDMLSSKLIQGGYLYFVTDWLPYAEFALEQLTQTPYLKNSFAGFAPHQEWRPETRFEEKGKQKQHDIFELMFKKT